MCAYLPCSLPTRPGGYFDASAARMMIQLVLIANLYASLFAIIIVVALLDSVPFQLSLFSFYIFFFRPIPFLTANSLPCVLTFSAFYIF